MRVRIDMSSICIGMQTIKIIVAVGIGLAMGLLAVVGMKAFPSFERDGTYVLYCEFGLKSAHLAELMGEAGFRAFHFSGGTRALRKWAEARASR